jgi:hypothetical protein
VARPPVEGITPIRLARPPFGYALYRPVLGVEAEPPRLVKVAERRNEITDEAEWFNQNGLTLPALRVPNGVVGASSELSALAPTHVGAYILVQGIDQGDKAVLIYGADFADGRLVAVVDKARGGIALLDFESFLTPPAFEPKDAPFVKGQVVWAVVEHGVLYLFEIAETKAKSLKK